MDYRAFFPPEHTEITAFFTGHRFIPEEDRVSLTGLLDEWIRIAYLHGYRRFFCGCALGFDTMAAFRVLELKKDFPDLILSLAVPCATQSDRWPEKDRNRYQDILIRADEKIVLSPVYYDGAMITRNRYMADRSTLCICYLRHMRGGTASTVRYALQQERIRIINLAVKQHEDPFVMREEPWNAIFTSPFANKNAIIVPLRLSREKMLSLKPTSISF